MLGYAIRRTLWAAVLFAVITLFTFVIFFILPADRTQIGRASSQAESADIRDAYEVEGNVFQAYGQYMWNLVTRFELGSSFATRQEVSEMVFRAAPVTAWIVIGGAVLWLSIAVPIGILSALRPRSLLDRATMIFVLIGISAHPAWVGIILLNVFSRDLGWFPLAGYCDLVSPSTSCGGLGAWAHHLVLPWITLSLLFAAVYTRMIRASVIEALDEDYVRTARAKGASEGAVLRHHVLRNSLVVVVTMLGMDMGLAMVGTVMTGGAIFVERVFSLPGIGSMVLSALPQRDLPVIAGTTLFVTTVIVILNLIVDLLYAWLDPRVRLSSRGEGDAEVSSGRAPSPAPAPAAAA